MNLKGKKIVASGSLLDEAFKDEGNVDLDSVDTSDLDSSNEINEFLDSLPDSSEIEQEEPQTTVDKEKAVKESKVKNESSSKMENTAESFKRIHQSNINLFKSLVTQFKEKVEYEDTTEFTIQGGKPFLKKMFESEGFTVEDSGKEYVIKF